MYEHLLNKISSISQRMASQMATPRYPRNDLFNSVETFTNYVDHQYKELIRFCVGQELLVKSYGQNTSLLNYFCRVRTLQKSPTQPKSKQLLALLIYQIRECLRPIAFIVLLISCFQTCSPFINFLKVKFLPTTLSRNFLDNHVLNKIKQ